MGIGKSQSLAGHLLLLLCSRVCSRKSCCLLLSFPLLSAHAHPPVQQEPPLWGRTPACDHSTGPGRGRCTCPWFPAPEGYTYCAEEGREGKTKQRGRTTELRQRSSRRAAFPISQRLWRASGPRRWEPAGSWGEEGARWAHPTYHDCGRGRSCLGGHRGLVGLVLRSFDFGLQVCRRVKIFAFLPHATPLYVIHTNGYGVVICVDHCAVCGVCEAAVGLPPGTVSSLELPAYLGHRGTRADNAEQSLVAATEPPGPCSHLHVCILIELILFCFSEGWLLCHLQCKFDYQEHK